MPARRRRPHTRRGKRYSAPSKSGKWADLILLDADPLADIRNTRRIWQVVHYGRLVDRPSILKVMKPR